MPIPSTITQLANQIANIRYLEKEDIPICWISSDRAPFGRTVLRSPEKTTENAASAKRKPPSFNYKDTDLYLLYYVNKRGQFQQVPLIASYDDAMRMQNHMIKDISLFIVHRPDEQETKCFLNYFNIDQYPNTLNTLESEVNKSKKAISYIRNSLHPLLEKLKMDFSDQHKLEALTAKKLDPLYEAMENKFEKLIKQQIKQLHKEMKNDWPPEIMAGIKEKHHSTFQNIQKKYSSAKMIQLRFSAPNENSVGIYLDPVKKFSDKDAEKYQAMSAQERFITIGSMPHTVVYLTLTLAQRWEILDFLKKHTNLEDPALTAKNSLIEKALLDRNAVPLFLLYTCLRRTQAQALVTYAKNVFQKKDTIQNIANNTGLPELLLNQAYQDYVEQIGDTARSGKLLSDMSTTFSLHPERIYQIKMDQETRLLAHCGSVYLTVQQLQSEHECEPPSYEEACQKKKKKKTKTKLQ